MVKKEYGMANDDIRETEDGNPVIALTEDVIVEMIDKLKSDLAIQQQNATLAADTRRYGNMASTFRHNCQSSERSKTETHFRLTT